MTLSLLSSKSSRTHAQKQTPKTPAECFILKITKNRYFGEFWKHLKFWRHSAKIYFVDFKLKLLQKVKWIVLIVYLQMLRQTVDKVARGVIIPACIEEFSSIYWPDLSDEVFARIKIYKCENFYEDKHMKELSLSGWLGYVAGLISELQCFAPLLPCVLYCRDPETLLKAPSSGRMTRKALYFQNCLRNCLKAIRLLVSWQTS